MSNWKEQENTKDIKTKRGGTKEGWDLRCGRGEMGEVKEGLNPRTLYKQTLTREKLSTCLVFNCAIKIKPNYKIARCSIKHERHAWPWPTFIKHSTC